MVFFSCDPAKSHICVVFHGWKKAHHSVDILCTAVDLVKGQQQYWPFHFLHRADVFLNPKLTRKRVSELKLGCVWGMLSIMVPERVVFLLSFFFLPSSQMMLPCWRIHRGRRGWRLPWLRGNTYSDYFWQDAFNCATTFCTPSTIF